MEVDPDVTTSNSTVPIPTESLEEEDIDYTTYKPSADDIQLLKAAVEGDLERCQYLLDNTGADPCFQDSNTGMSVLMAAAGSGYEEVVRLLLEEGAPWNAVDREYRCAGDYAVKNGHQAVVDCIMNHAVISEMLLGSVLKEQHRSENPNYLCNSVNYTASGDKLLDSEGLAVMMDWEKPLMDAHAEFICNAKTDAGQGRVLNVGFGMGIVDTEIQRYLHQLETDAPREHYIIEAHHTVLEKLKADGWYDKPGVVIMNGRWQDVVPNLIKNGIIFDGIFFDTYAEDDFDLKEFHQYLPNLMAEGGHYSFYNGMCPDNVFFHGVACETVRLQLKQLGFLCTFNAMPVNVSDGKVWSGVKSRYWYFDTYYLPQCVRSGDS